jgi:opacity protein-like surface antigen
MKKLFLLGMLFFLPLSAEQYVSLSGGSDYCHRTDENGRGQKVGFKVGGTYGYKFSNGLRGEVELCYRDGHKRTSYVYVEGADDQKTHVSSHSMSYMANLLYDIGALQIYGVTPYVGAGVGVCSNTYELKSQKGDNVVNRDRGKEDRFAYQAIVGGKYPIAEKLDLAAEYCYNVGQYHGKNHSFGLSLIRSF